MQLRTLSWRGASYYRRTNVAVVFGIACAVTVLAGALMVGESVRASLRELSLARLGRTDVVVTSETYFREALAADLGPRGHAAAPVVLAEAVVTNERSRQRASRVQIVGVDERFWAFHQVAPPAMRGADAWMSAGLARELSWQPDDTLIVRTRQASAIPAEFLHGRRDETGRAMRLRGAGILARDALGEFSLRPQQGEVRTLIVLMSRLQRELELAGRVNTVLLTGDRSAAESALRAHATLDDLGVRLRAVGPAELALESERGLLDDVTARVGDGRCGPCRRDGNADVHLRREHDPRGGSLGAVLARDGREQRRVLRPGAAGERRCLHRVERVGGRRAARETRGPRHGRVLRLGCDGTPGDAFGGNEAGADRAHDGGRSRFRAVLPGNQ